MKKTKNKQPARVREISANGKLDWTPLFQALEDAFEWALDVAVSLARDFPEEVEAVERVRAFIRARITGQPATLFVDDALFTFGLIIGAIECDLDLVGELAPRVYREAMRFPGANELLQPGWMPRLVPIFDRHTYRRPSA